MMREAVEIKKSVCRGLTRGAATTWKLARVVVPVYLLVTFLKYTPFLRWLTGLCAPLMRYFGLPGEAALALVMGNVLNIYSAVGVITSLSLSSREVTILAIMLLISHSLPMESAVAAQVRVNPLLIGIFRLVMSLGTGLLLNLAL
ncbi:nucleoside recognition domain-containing protein [Desulfofundulus sp.]|uniref:nucleoside recognition domain-containing protein n=1 Tax=Desulfofundulus sp. TaxID=2282750 RepID=UPI003C73CF90